MHIQILRRSLKTLHHGAGVIVIERDIIELDLSLLVAFHAPGVVGDRILDLNGRAFYDCPRWIEHRAADRAGVRARCLSVAGR